MALTLYPLPASLYQPWLSQGYNHWAWRSSQGQIHQHLCHSFPGRETVLCVTGLSPWPCLPVQDDWQLWEDHPVIPQHHVQPWVLLWQSGGLFTSLTGALHQCQLPGLLLVLLGPIVLGHISTYVFSGPADEYQLERSLHGKYGLMLWDNICHLRT